jgi:hypothetical protein
LARQARVRPASAFISEGMDQRTHADPTIAALRLRDPRLT